MSDTWNLIIDEVPQKGSWNMAVDEFLLESISESLQTNLRFYLWERPTVSLGYSQVVDKVVDVSYCKKNGIDIVRRMTGGKLVLHNQEVTYSVCSSDTGTFTDSLADSYRLISKGLIRGLELMGLKPYLADSPPMEYVRGVLPCFSHPAYNEVEIDGKKIVGSAQKRFGSQFLQHGSIPIGDDKLMLSAVSHMKGDLENIRIISLSQALGREVSFTWIVEKLKKGLAEQFKVSFMRRVFRPEEIQSIRKIQIEKYERLDWTHMR
ncbi:biotin/lipoate A/B protein ligase family protein [Acidobacteriota bacterium]